MKKFERVVYNLVRDNQKIKRFLRDTYQLICDIKPVVPIKSLYEVQLRPGFFFGFHDKSPFSRDDKYLLAHRETIPLRMPNPEDTVEIGYFSGNQWRDFHHIGKTRAWNWHQGAMLQWLGPTNEFIFNDFDGEEHISKIYSLGKDTFKTVDLPIAAVSPNGKYAISYNFVRSNRGMHGYGYSNGCDPEANSLIPKNDGLRLIELSSRKSTLLFSVNQIAEIEPDPTMKGSFHWFTHCQFSPSGKRFKFFHRWIKENDYSRWTRMFSCNIDGTELHLFPTYRMVSHVGWVDDSHLVAYARTKEFDDGYFLFHDRTNYFTPVGRNLFSSDGHPSFSKNRRWMLTDTYPDAFRRQRLVLYDMQKQIRYDIAHLYLPKKFIGPLITDHWTVDLHPRWSRDNSTVCFDCGYTGVRSLATIGLGNLEEEGMPKSIM